MTLSEFFKSIADAIRGKDGTTDSITASDFATRIEAIETGIDTSDATATASDIASGKTAYVNGNKVSGGVTVVSDGVCESVNYSYLDNVIDPSVMNVRGVLPVDKLYRNGSYVGVPIPIAEFGDATAADVVSGKTFTSAAGLKVAGTLSVPDKIGFSERLNDGSEDGAISVSCDYNSGIITITPQLVLEQYSAGQIDGVDNLTVQVYEAANSVYHRLAVYFVPTDVYPRRCRFLYTWWTGKNAPDNASSTIELVLEGNITTGMRWDDESKVVTISDDGDFLTALNTIVNESTTDPSISGVITWRVVPN